MAGAGEAASQKSTNPAAVTAREAHQQRDGAPGAAGEPHTAGAARQDAEVETAHRGGGLGGAQPGGGEQFDAEVDRAELDRDADGGHHGQQPAGQRGRQAVGGPPGRPGGQRLAPVAQDTPARTRAGRASTGRQPAGVPWSRPSSSGASTARPAAPTSRLGRRGVTARAVALGQGGRSTVAGSSGEAEDGGAEHGQSDRAGRAEQGGAGHGADRRAHGGGARGRRRASRAKQIQVGATAADHSAEYTPSTV